MKRKSAVQIVFLYKTKRPEEEKMKLFFGSFSLRYFRYAKAIYFPYGKSDMFVLQTNAI